jgi:hypothetical protein
MGLINYVGSIVEKKEVQGEDDRSYLSYKVGILGAFLDVKRTERNFNDFSEGDLVKVAVFPKPSSVKTEFGTYNFSIPEVLGIEKAKDIKEILVVPRGDIQVLKYDLIKMKDSKDPKKEISYTKLLLSGDINGEITGSKDIVLENMQNYTALMTLGIKKGQLQFLPSDFRVVSNGDK